MEFKAGYAHSGLPDRDKIKELYPAVRNPLPRELAWVVTNNEVASLNWLHLPEPLAGGEIGATCRDNSFSITTRNVENLHVLVDERLVDYQRPIRVDINGKESMQRLEPSLRTLCETLADRGDPEFMFATRVVVVR
jgi:hypothetical protein